nr:ORF1 [Banfec anellovirus 2]
MLLRRSSTAPAGMAYYWRSAPYYRRRYYRRRYGQRGLYRTYRRRYGRRYPRRRRVRWRKLYRAKALRDRGRIPQTVVQWRPRYHTRCTIRGYMPLMFALGAHAGIQDIQLPTANYQKLWLGGGVDCSTMNLLDLYWEEKFYRAYWTKSNQGFNMAKYKGCKLTLWPQQFFSYIFWWSTDDLIADAEPLTFCHPSQMILAKQHVVVPRYYGQFKKKPVIIYIKPPSSLNSQWFYTVDLAKKPLVKWRASLINFETPWTGFIDKNTTGVPLTVWMYKSSEASGNSNIVYYPLFDDGTEVSLCYWEIPWNDRKNGPNTGSTQAPGFWPNDAAFQKLLIPFWLYAFGRNANYYLDQQEYHMPKASTHKEWGLFLFIMIQTKNNAWRHENGKLIEKKDKFYLKYEQVAQIAASGPWVEKQIPNGVNFILEYKFYFQWGGTPGTKLPPVAPAAGEPVWPKATYRWPQSLRADIRDPQTVTAEVLGDEDYDSDGIVTDAALRRITKLDFLAEAPRKRQMAWGYKKSFASPQEKKRKRSSYETGDSEEEEETEDDSSSTLTEDSQREAEHHHLKHRRKRLRKRLVRFLLDRGIRLHGSTSLSGRQRSSSI